jgi:uncharacterized repeat protein (TIGR01451 family)
VSDLWLTKDASRSFIDPGTTFDYTIRAGNNGLGSAESVVLVDDMPDVLQVLSVTPVVPADPAAPAWTSCTIANQLPNGYGGEVTCTLDRPLGFGETVPDVVLNVRLDPKASAGAIDNVVTLTAEDSPPNLAARFALGGLPTLSLQANAVVLTAGLKLALTGSSVLSGLLVVLVLLTAGVLLLIIRRRRSA